jgi:hypothetical protein
VTRQAIREMKRAVRAGGPGASDGSQALAKDCALSLLNRSISFGHGRLAVIRLVMAVRAGAEIPVACWVYCCNAVEASKDPLLQGLYLTAATESSTRPAEPTKGH